MTSSEVILSSFDYILTNNEINRDFRDKVDKYIFDLFVLLNNLDNKKIKLTFYIPNKMIHNQTLDTNVTYISYYNGYTSNIIRNKLKIIIKDKDDYIDNIINIFNNKIIGKKNDAIFVLFSTPTFDSQNNYIPILIKDNNIKLLIKYNDKKIFNTNDYF
tara:strand:+ start:351 stop:827 length:477 start_codon:yes stop_codon:yes gene_type:complete